MSRLGYKARLELNLEDQPGRMNSGIEKVPVVLFGSGLTVLGALRSFGRAGVEVYCVCSETEIVGDSRWFREPPTAKPDRCDPASLEKFLESLPWDKCFLMPCADAWIGVIAEVSSRNPGKWLACQPTANTTEMFIDKGRFAELVDRLNVPHPITFKIESSRQLEELELDDFSGSFLKPCNSYEFHRHYGIKACHVTSREDAVRQFEKKKAAGFEMMFQEYIQGAASRHFFIDGFVDRGGKILAVFARQRLRMYPPDFGNSTYMVSVSTNTIEPAVTDLKRLLTETDYRGIYSAEFKFDEKDGKYKVLEVNVRPWWFVEFAARCGVDVCMMSYRDALGGSPREIESYREGVRFVHPYYDINICRQLREQGKLRRGACIRSWIGAEHPIFCWDDPFPAVKWIITKICSKIRKIFSGRNE